LIRLAFCLDSLDIGGTELNAVRTLEALDRSRFAPLLLHFRDGPLLERCRRAAIPTLRLPLRSLAKPSALITAGRLVRILRSHRIEVFHAQDVYSDILGVPCARVARVPLVVASRRWHESTPRPVHRIASRLGFRLADVVTVNSASTAATMLAEMRLPPERVVVVSNFVSEAAFEQLSPSSIAEWRARLGLPTDRLVIGCVARLVPVKHHDMLLRGFAAMRQATACHLALAGDGPLRAPLEAAAAELGIAGRVSFLGHVESDRNLNQLFDIVALSSRHEGFPNALVEAMAAARPVIATAVPGNVDAVEAGRTGLLVPDSDPTALAAALDDLVANAGLRETLGMQGKARALERYRQDAVIGALSDLYVSRLGAKRQRP